MAAGIGIDMVSIDEVARYVDGSDLTRAETLDPFVRRTFTAGEIGLAAQRHNPAEFLAGRFAVKEAVFKALAHPSGEFLEFYEIETLSYDDGAPYVTKTPAVERALEKAGASELLVSITNEGNYAVAIVLAQ